MTPREDGVPFEEQWQLFKTQQEISLFQHDHGLVRVTALPTHAALHSSWPETLTTMAINVVVLWWSYGSTKDILKQSQTVRKLVRILPYGRQIVHSWIQEESKNKPKLTWYPESWIFTFLVPVFLIGLWFAQFSVAEIRHVSAGWVDVNLTPAGPLILSIGYWVAVKKHCLALILAIVTGLHIGAVITIVVQRSVPVKGFGTVAYNITDSSGCVPVGNMTYLEGGARAPTFKAIQKVQIVYSILLLIAIPAVILTVASVLVVVAFPFVKAWQLFNWAFRWVKWCFSGSSGWQGNGWDDADLEGGNGQGPGEKKRQRNTKREKFKRVIGPVIELIPLGFSFASLGMSFALFLYEVAVALRGIPVVLSGNCMLVELSPKLGFWDAPIDPWWKVLVQLVGL